KKALRDLARNWHNKRDGLIRVSVDPHSPYTVDPEYMRELKEIRKELNQEYGSSRVPLIWHIHVAETDDETEKIRKAFKMELKEGIMKYLDLLGVLDEYVIAAHCVSLVDKDMSVMKKRGVKVSHSPISNLKLASGISPVPKMLKEGITVSLGTDGPCANNTADMFEIMKTAAILHKGVAKDPTLLPAEQVLEMATIEGAKALAWDNEIGSIEVGKKADLAIIDLKKPHLCPSYNAVSHLVYAAKASDVEAVIVNGEIVMENRKLAKLDVEKVMGNAEKVKSGLLNKL
ncbi:MAG: amidohydrolase family protein, partial [Candidatus Bathyarchaeota archaeon]|nr:amidohydrolase family protein [Candidatus Bathyarchaeota archaeon]